MKTTLKWLERWFLSNCDGDWEHANQVIVRFKIESVSNPGWSIEIDLTDTDLEDLHFQMPTINSGPGWPSIEQDWWLIKIQNRKFIAGGDTSKLEFLLEKFRTLVETKDINTILGKP